MYTAATVTDFNQRVGLGNSYCNCLMCRVVKNYLVHRAKESTSSQYTVLKYSEFVNTGRVFFSCAVECNMVIGNFNKKIRLPIRSQKKCNLRASIFRRSITNKTLYCETCNINLCVDCYKVFYTQTNNIVDNRRQQQRTLGIKIELQTKKQRIL